MYVMYGMRQKATKKTAAKTTSYERPKNAQFPLRYHTFFVNNCNLLIFRWKMTESPPKWVGITLFCGPHNAIDRNLPDRADYRR